MHRKSRMLIQFVEGDEKTEFSQQRSLQDMRTWCKEYGLKITKYWQHQFVDCWTFILIEKK